MTTKNQISNAINAIAYIRKLLLRHMLSFYKVSVKTDKKSIYTISGNESKKLSAGLERMVYYKNLLKALLLLNYTLKIDLWVTKTASKNKIQNTCSKETFSSLQMVATDLLILSLIFGLSSYL